MKDVPDADRLAVLIVTSLTASAAALLLYRLSMATVRVRRGSRIPVGTGAGDDERLLRAVRAHANFIEYVPILLILLGLSEWNGAPRWLLAPIALVVLAGRLMHAHSLTSGETARADDPGMSRFVWRVRGMQATLFPLLILAATTAISAIVAALR